MQAFEPKDQNGNPMPESDFIVDQIVNKGYAVCDQFISENHVVELLEILRTLEAEDNFKKAGIGTYDQFHVNNQIRGDYIKWIEHKDAKPPTKAYLNKILDLLYFLNRSCFLGLKDFESHYTRYPKNTFYKKHLDQFQSNPHRRLSFILYLNQDWQKGDGGELRIYLNEAGDSFIDIEPIASRFVCFRSELIEHEVLLCHKERYSITGWMLDQLSELTFLSA